MIKNRPFLRPVKSLNAGTMLLCLISSIVLGGCQTVQNNSELSCSAWKPIFWSRNDTPQTIVQVKQNNAAHDEWCKN